MNVFLREATVEDAKTISSIGITSWQAAYIGIVPDEYVNSLSTEKREAHLAKSLENPTYRFVIGEVEEQAIGMMCFYPACNDECDEGEWELEALYLLPQYWNKGIGSMFMQYAFRYMRKHKARECKLWVLADNNRARKFYEKMGLVYSGVERNITIGGKDLVKVCYRISL